MELVAVVVLVVVVVVSTVAMLVELAVAVAVMIEVEQVPMTPITLVLLSRLLAMVVDVVNNVAVILQMDVDACVATGSTVCCGRGGAVATHSDVAVADFAAAAAGETITKTQKTKRKQTNERTEGETEKQTIRNIQISYLFIFQVKFCKMIEIG